MQVQLCERGTETGKMGEGRMDSGEIERNKGWKGGDS